MMESGANSIGSRHANAGSGHAGSCLHMTSVAALRIFVAVFLLFTMFVCVAEGQSRVWVVAHDAEVDEGDRVSFDLNVSGVPAGGVNIRYRMIQFGDIRYRPSEHIESAEYGLAFISRSGTVTVSYNTVADNYKEEDYEFEMFIMSLERPTSGDIVPTTCSNPVNPNYLNPLSNECSAVTVVRDGGGGSRVGEIPSAINYASVSVPRYIAPGDPFTITFSLTRPAPASGVTLLYGMYELDSDYLGDTVAPLASQIARHDIYIPPGSTSVRRSYRTGLSDRITTPCNHRFGSMPQGDVKGCIVVTLIETPGIDAAAGEYDAYPARGERQVEGILVIDRFVGLSIDDVRVREDQGPAEFTLSVTKPTGARVTVDLATMDGTALAPGDYTRTTRTVSFSPWARRTKFTIPVINDSIAESDETFRVLLSNASNAMIVDDTGIATIVDDGDTNIPQLPELSINDVTVAEDAGPAVFTISMSRTYPQDVHVNIVTTDGSAVQPGDYTRTQSAAVIAAGTSSITFSVPVINDTAVEPAETFNVRLSGAVNGRISDDTGVATITDDDALPEVSVNNVTVAENAGPAIFILSLSGPSTTEVRVDVTTADGTAVQPGDYTQTGSTAVFAPGSTSLTFPVPIIDDDVPEPVETFTVELSSPTGARIADGQGIGTITDGDVHPELSIDDVTVAENAGPAIFTLSLSKASVSEIRVDVTTGDGTALQPGDYTATGATVVFAAGMTSRTFSVPIINDTVLELSETFTVQLDSATNAVIADGSGTGTITDDDVALPGLSINDVTVAENAGTAVFTLSLSRTSTSDIRVDVATRDGTALHPGDYSETQSTALIVAGTSSITFSVPIVDDTLDEPNETFTVILSGPVNAVIADGSGTGTIIDNDDPLPGLSINDVTVAENAGTAVFTLSLSRTSTSDIRVDVATRDGTALHPGDYSETQSTALIAAGTSSITFSVPIADDTLDEPDETFTVILSGPVNAVIADGSGTGTIIDNDDPLPGLSVNDVTVAENAGTAVFALSLSRTSTSDIRVDVATRDGTALQPGDYSETQSTALIAAGTSSITFSVPIADDTLDEPDETFTVILSGPVNAVIADGSGTGTIIDNDGVPRISINDIRLSENAGTAVFDISLSNASASPVTVNAATRDGTAVQPADYTRTSGTVTFAPGAIRQTFRVPVVNDALDEPDETFTVRLDTASGASIADDTGIATIEDDGDAAPDISIGNITIAENAGPAVFTLTISRASGHAVTVTAATRNGTALQPGDYTRTSGTVTFAPGILTRRFEVPIINDNMPEPVETFTVVLASAVNASIANETGLGTITDEDAHPRLSINDVTVSEHEQEALFTISLSKPSGHSISFNAATRDGTALHPSDYTQTSSPIGLAPGLTSETFAVPIINDDLDEPDETFTVVLTAPMNITFADETGIGTIIDNDDALPQLFINDARVAEETGQAIFTISLSKASANTVSLTATTGDGTALQPGDYTRTSARVTFTPGSVSQRFAVPIINDNIPEPDENFTVTLTLPSNAEIADGSGIGTILDRHDGGPAPEDLPRLQVSDVTVAESAGRAVFVVSLSRTFRQTVSVNVSTDDGTALQTHDYIRTRTTVSFAPGERIHEFVVPIVDDDLAEVTETFTVRLDTPAHAIIHRETGTGTITDDDDAVTPDPVPEISINDVTVSEADGQAVFILSLSRTSTQSVTVNAATRDGSARHPDDYIRTSATVVFAPGTVRATFPVPVVQDSLFEFNEMFTVRIDTASGASIVDDRGIATITDDDMAPGVSINDVTVAENVGLAVFTLSLSTASGIAVSVNATTLDGSAMQPGDYTRTSSVVNFAPGILVQRFSVPVIDDDLVEFNESFTVQLAGVVNAIIVDETGLGTITDEDTGGPGPDPEPRPALSINDVTVTEDAGPAIFTLSLSRTSTATITVNAATRDGSARHPGDYTRTSSVITFAPGTVSVAFPVPVIDDEIPEPNETFTVRLASASGASIADHTGIAIITDDGDRAPEISVNDVTLAENEGPAMFTISLSKASGHEISLTATTRNGTALAPADYIHTSARVIFPAGTTVREFPVPVTDDTVAEPDEDFTLNLVTSINAVIADPVGLGRIIDNDDPDDGPGPENAPPVADAGPDQRVYFNETVRLDGSGSYDPDGDSITHAWRPLDPSAPVLTAANSVHPGFIAGPAIAIHQFQLTVRDPSGLSSTDTVSIHVVQDPLPLEPPIGEFILDRQRATLNDQPDLIRFLRGVQQRPSGSQGQSSDVQRPSTSRVIYDAYTYSGGKYGKAGGQFTAVATPERASVATEFHRGGFWGEFTGIRSRTLFGNSLHLAGSFGFHRVQSKRLLYGVMAQFQSSDTRTAGYNGEISGKSWFAGPYFAARLKSQPIYFEGRFLLGKSSNTVEINEPGKGTRTGHFTTSRRLAQLRMEGNINLGSHGTRLIPYADIRHIQGEADPFMATTERGTQIRVSGQTVRTAQFEFGTGIEIPVVVRKGEMLLTAGAGLILSRTKGQYVRESSSKRGRMEAGLQYRLDQDVLYEFDAFIDGIAASGYRGYGLSLAAEYKF